MKAMEMNDAVSAIAFYRNDCVFLAKVLLVALGCAITKHVGIQMKQMCVCVCV